MTLAIQTRTGGSLCGLAQVSPVKGRKWKALLALATFGARVAALEDPAIRAELVAELVAEGMEKGMWYDPNTGARPGRVLRGFSRA